MLKRLGIAAITLLAYAGLHAQASVPEKDFPLPKVPSFHREYKAGVSIPLVSTPGDIYWQARSYVEGGDSLTEIRGNCDLDAKLGPVHVTNIYLGLITTIDKSRNTIETIIYSGEADSAHFSPGDSALARKYRIDLSKATGITRTLADYNTDTLIDLDTKKKIALDGSIGLQEAYFIVRNGGSTVLPIHCNGKIYMLPVVAGMEDGRKTLCIDMTYPDPDDPGRRVPIIKKFYSLKIYEDGSGLPVEVKAQIRAPIVGKTTATAKEK